MTAVAWRPVRSHLRAVRRSHASRSLRDVVGTVYEWGLYLFVLGGVLVTALQSSTASLATPPAGAGTWLAATALLAGAGTVAAVLRAFGPIVVGPAYASWLLPAPLDRAGLLAGRAVGVVVGTAVLAGGLTGLLAAGTGAASPVLAGTAAGVGALAVAATCIRVQASAPRAGRTSEGPAWGRSVRSAVVRPSATVGGSRVDLIVDGIVRTVLGTALLAAAALVIIVRAGVDLPTPVPPSPFLVAALCAVPAFAACLVAWWHLGRAGTAALTRGTSLVAALSAGSTALDPSITAGAIAERRLLRRGVVRSGRHRPGRRRALLRANLRSALRHGPALVTAVTTVVLTHVAGVLVPEFAVPVVQLAGATAVAAGFATSLRTVAGSATLRRDLGGRDRELVALHCVVPFAAAVAWTLLVAGSGGTAVSLVLLPLSALAVVARHATRPPPSTTMTLYESPVGISIPIELVRDLSRGPALFVVLAGVQMIVG